MPEKKPNQPATDAEMLHHAEKFAGFARSLYAREDGLANTAALISLAGSALVIARSITGLMETSQPKPEVKEGARMGLWVGTGDPVDGNGVEMDLPQPLTQESLQSAVQELGKELGVMLGTLGVLPKVEGE